MSKPHQWPRAPSYKPQLAEKKLMAKIKSPAARPQQNGQSGKTSQSRRTLVPEILEITARVNAGLLRESSALDAAVAETNELARSLKETATQAASVASSAEDSGSSVIEIGASV